MIHDCGSFSAEYLFTNHPCCFLLKDDATTLKNSNEFHRACIDNHYKAYDKDDIIKFIEDVIIKKQDLMKKKRKVFFNKFIKNNYPNTSRKIIKYIKKELKK